jgi:hypothetical protein
MVMDDDGTNPFGTHESPTAEHWDTDEWREQMRERYDTQGVND